MTEIKNTSVIEFEDFSDEQMNQMIDGTLTEFDEGDLVGGIVVKIEHDEVLVDIGFKSEGVIPSRELSIRKDADPADIVSLGEQIEALVLQKEDKDGRLILSKKRAEYERAWIQVEDKFKAGEVVTGEVIEVVKGGLILDIGLRGFLPASLVDLRRVKDLDMYMGTEIEARVIEMDRNRNNVVLSRRVLLEEGRKNERAEILEKLTKGMRLKGSVSSIVDFGAFVDLGGIDGLVHISELSWSHVNHPSEVVKVGDEVEVEVLDVDLQRERISLGLKQTTEDPWIKLVENYPIGTIVDGKVTKIVPFGAFIELGDNVEGLVHISEMSLKHIDSPAQVVHVGDEVKVKVMEINPERRRISLSMKAAAEELGFEIPIDETVIVEERPAKKKAEKPEEQAAVAPEAAEAVEAEAAAEPEAVVEEAAAPQAAE
ncbi:MAG: 30S ribosomal protein S1 [Raoultibacter sp.]